MYKNDIKLLEYLEMYRIYLEELLVRLGILWIDMVEELFMEFINLFEHHSNISTQSPLKVCNLHVIVLFKKWWAHHEVAHLLKSHSIKTFY